MRSVYALRMCPLRDNRHTGDTMHHSFDEYVTDAYENGSGYGEALNAWHGDRAHGLEPFDTLALDEYAQIARMWATTPIYDGDIARELRAFADACETLRTHRLTLDTSGSYYL